MEEGANNPFRFGKIVEGNCFCNRTQEIALIRQFIQDGQSLWLFSPRRYGKSSLIHRVFHETGKVVTIYIDLYNVKSVDDFCRKYSDVLARELFDWRTGVMKLTKNLAQYFTNLYPKISFDENGSPSFSLEKQKIVGQTDISQVLNIPEEYAKNKKIRICVAFDEFQEVERIDPFIINWMRSAFQNHQNVSYIFLGSKQSLMESIFADINSPFYEFAQKMDINPIPKNELFDFIKGKFTDNNLRIEDITVEEILNKSQGHPHFTQYFASVVFNFIRNGADQSNENFAGKWMEYILDSQNIIFQNIYDQLNANQRRTLSAIACASDDAALYSGEFRQKFDLPASSTLTITLKSLVKKDLINKNKEKYSLNNPVLSEWLVKLNER